MAHCLRAQGPYLIQLCAAAVAKALGTFFRPYYCIDGPLLREDSQIDYKKQVRLKIYTKH